MMEIIIDKNTNLNKEKLIVESLENDIKDDLKNNDLKSLKYHSMALKEHQKILNDFKQKEDLENVSK